MRQIRSSAGQLSLSGLMFVSLSVAAVYMLANGVNFVSKMQRGVASNASLDELSLLIHLLLDNPNRCASAGIVGLSTEPLFQTPSSAVPVKLALDPNAAGVGVKTAQVLAGGAMFDSKREIVALDLISLIPETDTSGVVSNSQYLGVLKLLTSVRGTAITMQSPSKEFFLNLSIDPTTKVITSCRSTSTVQPTPPPPQTAGYSKFEAGKDVLPNKCSSGMKYHNFYCDTQNNKYPGWYVDVQFQTTFAEPPIVVASVEDPIYPPESFIQSSGISWFWAQSKCDSGAVDGFSVFVENVTTTGFRLFCNGNPLTTCVDGSNKQLGNAGQIAKCSWVAMGK